METMYQRGKIQEESLYYETRQARRHAAADRRQYLPLRAATSARANKGAELIRSTEEEKQDQVAAVRPSRPAMRRTRRRRSSSCRARRPRRQCFWLAAGGGQGLLARPDWVGHALYQVGGMLIGVSPQHARAAIRSASSA
jgi:hypothetical protein